MQEEEVRVEVMVMADQVAGMEVDLVAVKEEDEVGVVKEVVKVEEAY